MRGFHDKGNDNTVIIITHGIGGNKLGHKCIFKQFSDFCVDHVLSVLRFDFIGFGESDGDFSETKHSEQVFQVREIIKHARSLNYKNIILASTTIGCYSVWHNVNIDNSICGFVNWNLIFNLDKYYKDSTKYAKANGEIDTKGLYTKKTYIDDLNQLSRIIPNISQEILILQGDLDHEYKNQEALKYSNSYDNFTYLTVPNGNHLFESNQARNFLFHESIRFIKQICKN